MKQTFKDFLAEQIVDEDAIICEEVWMVDDEEITEDILSEALESFEDDEELFEAAKRAFKRMGQAIRRYYRCKGGPKDGKLVADPKSCATRKDPKKVRHGRKVARMKKGVRVRKTIVSKRKSLSRMVTNMNKRLSGKA